MCRWEDPGTANPETSDESKHSRFPSGAGRGLAQQRGCVSSKPDSIHSWVLSARWQGWYWFPHSQRGRQRLTDLAACSGSHE